MINQNNPKKNNQKNNNEKSIESKPTPLRKTVDDPENDLFDDELFGADGDFEDGVPPKEIPKVLPDKNKENNPDNFEKPW